MNVCVVKMQLPGIMGSDRTQTLHFRILPVRSHIYSLVFV